MGPLKKTGRAGLGREEAGPGWVPRGQAGLDPTGARNPIVRTRFTYKLTYLLTSFALRYITLHYFTYWNEIVI